MSTSNDLLRILLASAVQEDMAVKIKSSDGKTLYYLKETVVKEPVKK